MAMKRIAAMLLASVLLLSCGLLSACTQNSSAETSTEDTTFAPAADGQNAEQTPAATGPEKAELGLTAEVKPATDFTAKANAAVYD